MARNGSGTYTVPNTFVAGTAITAAGHNQNWSDIASEMTGSVAADGQTTITGAIKFVAGSLSAPGISFVGDTDTGFYRIAANNLGISAGGTKVLDATSTSVTIPVSLVAPITGLDVAAATALTAPAIDDSLPVYDLSATTVKKIALSDLLKVTDSLTADATPDAAADYVLTYDASATAAKKVLLSNFPGRLPRGYIDGCTLSNGTDATNDINIAAGVCRDSTNAVDITVPAITGKQLDANWAAGGSAGMRNSAAGIANGTYHIYAVRTAASASADIYAYAGVAGTDPDSAASISAMLTALQAESGGASYVYARRIGSILREGATIVAFTQWGDYFERTAIKTDISASDPGASAVTRTLSVPAGVVVEANTLTSIVSTSVSTYVLLTALAATDDGLGVGKSQLFVLSGAGGAASTAIRVRTNASAQIRSRLSASDANTTLTINTRGWWDRRGKDA